MKHFKYYLFCCLMICVCRLAQSSEVTEKTQLYIGIEKHRKPYSSLNDQQQPQGILINAILPLCESIKAQCDFISGSFEQLLQDLQTLRLDALVVIDTVVLPDIDKIKLSSPLCQLTPVFIQKQNAPPRTQAEDVEHKTLGVLQGSLFHLYLLDEYGQRVRLRTYAVLEHGVFDLISGRIDALFAEQAFFKERILGTPLGRSKRDATPLVALTMQMQDQQFPSAGMRLAVSEQNNKLFEAFEQVLRDRTLAPCGNLLKIEEANG